MITEEYVAQHRINAPGTYAAAYMRGDGVSAQVVADWGLAVPDDVQPADGYRPPRPAEDSTDRASWEAYVVGQGSTLDDARAASLDELRAMHDPDPEPEPPAHDLPAGASPEGVDGTGVQNPTPVDNVPSPVHDPQNAPPREIPDRPAESARKPEWVEWAIAAGADPAWANSDDTTKADLIAWQPGQADGA